MNGARTISLMVLLMVIVSYVAPSDDPDGLARAGAGMFCTGRRIRGPRGPRVVIYVRGTDAQVAEQERQCLQLCEQQDYVIAAIARDEDVGLSAWEDAQRMRQMGHVARVIVASASIIPPNVLESVTGSLPGPVRVARTGSRHLRTGPMRR